MNPTRKQHSRRTFMKRLGISCAAVGSAPYVITRAAGALQKSDPVIRMGIVGGRFGLSFYWHEHPHAKVTAVCDLLEDRRQAMMKTYRCDTAYADFDDIIRDKNVDAIGVFTPAPLHVYMAVEAMKAGKHVISAVPACMTEEEGVELLETVKKTGMTYMMAETSYYRREMISCMQWAKEKKFGTIFYSEAEYHHDGLMSLFFDDRGLPTWRHGFPPMHYPTHSTGIVIPVTGERLVEVTCVGWGDDHEVLRTNMYQNPFWSETAMFKTSGGHMSRIAVYWKVASVGIERGQFYGTEMSYFMPRHEGGKGIIGRREWGTVIRNNYEEGRIAMEEYDQPYHYELLPEPLRHDSGHGGSHTFLTHEFVSALVEKRQPTVDVYEALAYTIPGIYAHKSALEGGTTLTIPDYGRA